MLHLGPEMPVLESQSAADGLTQRASAAIGEALAGRGGSLSAFLFVGPAVIASIAYMDPGNFATNIQAGARYGYALLWVVLAANVVAMLFQALSAKLGVVTGKSLAELCRERLPAWAVWMLWIVAEIAAMATDLAEFVGGAIGVALIVHMPMMAAMAVVGVATYGFLLLEARGFRPIEIAIGVLVGAIGLCYVLELAIAPVDWGAAAFGAVTPRLPDAGAIALSVGIIGATVMPHAIFLHSSLTAARATLRNDAERAIALRYSNYEVLGALTLAGLVNMAMVVMASSAFHARHPEVAEIETAYKTLVPALGAAAASVFLVSLIVSGVSSSVVGTMVMQGFVGFRIPVWIRRLLTMIPAFVVVALGVDTMQALIDSQIVLSLALPAPMIALVAFTGDQRVMGDFVNGLWTKVAAGVASAFVLGLNLLLIAQALGIPIPGLADPA
jgi:manganese transport protein